MHHWKKAKGPWHLRVDGPRASHDLLIADTRHHVGTVLKQWQTASLLCKVPATSAFESFEDSGQLKARRQQFVNVFQFQQRGQVATVWNPFCPSWYLSVDVPLFHPSLHNFRKKKSMNDCSPFRRPTQDVFGIWDWKAGCSQNCVVKIVWASFASFYSHSLHDPTTQIYSQYVDDAVFMAFPPESSPFPLHGPFSYLPAPRWQPLRAFRTFTAILSLTAAVRGCGWDPHPHGCQPGTSQTGNDGYVVCGLYVGWGWVGQ